MSDFKFPAFGADPFSFGSRATAAKGPDVQGFTQAAGGSSGLSLLDFDKESQSPAIQSRFQDLNRFITGN
jgi:hypothetical protein